MTPDDLNEFLQKAVDEGFVNQIYRLASVKEAEVLAAMRNHDLNVYTLDDVAKTPTADLDACADDYLQMARRNGAIAGATYGFGGILTTLPEVAHILIAVVRTAQRLSLVYGQEFESFRGGMQLWEAIGEAFGVETKDIEGADGEFYSKLPISLGQAKGIALDPATFRVAQKVLLTIAIPLVGRWARILPLVGVGVSSLGNYALLRQVGKDLKQAFRSRHVVNLAATDADSQEIAFTLVN